MLNTFIKTDCSKESNLPIYVNETDEGNFKTTLGTGEKILILNRKQAEEYRDKLNLALNK